MSTSGNTIYQVGRDILITAAIRKLGVLAEGQVPTTENINDGIVALNMLVAKLRGKGLPLWARKTYPFSLTLNTAVYQIGIGKTLNTPYPLHVLQAYRVDGSDTTKIDVQVIPNYNFNLYPTSSGGTPIQLSYQPFINYGEISVWPVPDTAALSTTITIIYQAPFEYFNAATDTMDFPEEWYMPIVYNLAVALAPEWGIPLADRSQLKEEAKMYLDEVENMGYEDGSFYAQPRRVGR